MVMEVDFTIKEKGGRPSNVRLTKDFSGALTFEQFENLTKNALISISKEVLREEQARGFDDQPVVRVDNKVGRSIQSVKPFGKIEFFSRTSAKEMILGIYRMIQERTPVDTGLYRSQNLVFFNGEQVASNTKELEVFVENKGTFREKDRIRFVNAAPYAHALERYGITSSRRRKATRKSRDKKGRSGPRVLKPNGVYALSFRAARKQFKANAVIKFNLLPGDVLGITQPIPPNSRQRFRTTFSPKSKYSSGPYIYPTIAVNIQEQGIKQ